MKLLRLARWTAAAIVSAFVVSACAASSHGVAPSASSRPATASPRPTLLIYGDSLTVLSESATRQRYGDKYDLVFKAVSGSGMCDWLDETAADRKAYRPTRVVLAFTGNVSNCSAHDFIRGGLTALVANYDRSLRSFASTFHDVPITVVAPPAMTTANTVNRGWYPCNGNPALLAMYKRVSADLKLTYSSVADQSLTPDHVYTAFRPAFGTKAPMTRVRTLDGIHLTPAGSIYYAVALAG